MSYRDKFYSKYASTQTSQLYGETTLGGIKKQFPVWQRYFGRFLPENKNAKILDLGCGNGGFVWWLQQIGYQNAGGIDVSVEQVEAAKKLGIKNIRQANIKKFLNAVISDASNINVNVRTSEVQNIKYDVIFMRDVLEHFNKDEIITLLEKVYRALKGGSILIIQTPNAESPFGGRYRYGDFTHEISFTESSISQVLRVSGFNKISIFPVRPAIHGLKSFIRYYLWICVEYCLRLYLLIETGSGKGIFTQNLIVLAKK